MTKSVDGRTTSKQLATQHIARNLFSKKATQQATNRKLTTSSPSLAEIRTAIKALKFNKAAGEDGIQSVILIADSQTAAEFLHTHIAAPWKK